MESRLGGQRWAKWRHRVEAEEEEEEGEEEEEEGEGEEEDDNKEEGEDNAAGTDRRMRAEQVARGGGGREEEQAEVVLSGGRGSGLAGSEDFDLDTDDAAANDDDGDGFDEAFAEIRDQWIAALPAGERRRLEPALAVGSHEYPKPQTLNPKTSVNAVGSSLHSQ